jgi:hypothetical protein
MAKRIDTVFTADPNAGNDPSKTASVAVDFGTSTEEAYSLEQISSVVANRLGISENLPDQATFSARFPDNSLIATVDPIQTAYEYYVINTTGTTPTSGGTTGALAFTAADWESYTYYLFISDNDSTYAQVEPATDDPANDGLTVPGLVLQAVYTLSPPAITDLTITTPIAGSGNLVINYTEPTVVDGIASVNAEVTRNDTGAAVFTYQDVTTGDTLGNLPNGVVLDVAVIVTANNGKTSSSNVVTETIPLDTAGTYDGEIYILKTSEYREDEGVNITVTFGLRDSLSDANVDFDVRLVGSPNEGTATAGTNYTDWSDPETISFTSVSGGVKTVTKDIVTLDVDMASNLQGQIHIIPDSVAGGTGNGTATIAAHEADAALFYIDGTAALDGESFTIETLTDDSANTGEGFVFEATNWNSKDDGAYSGTAAFGITTADNGTHVNITNRFYVDGVLNSVDGSSLYSYSTDSPSVTYSLDFLTKTGVFKLHARANIRKSWEDNFFPLFDGAESWTNPSGIPAQLALTGDPPYFTWQQVSDSNGDPLTITISSGGVHTFTIAKHSSWVNIDRWCLVKDTSGTYDPGDNVANSRFDANDDYYGDDETAKAGGTIVDNPANLGSVTQPDPGGTALAPTTLSPTDGNTSASLTAQLITTWEAGSNGITITTFVVSDSVGVISGTYATNTGNSVTWTPTSNYVEGEDYTVDEITGTILDATGALQSINFTTWNFTAFSSSTALLSVDFSTEDPGTPRLTTDESPALSYRPGLEMTATDWNRIFGGSIWWGVTEPRQYAFFAQDPIKTGTNNTVMSLRLPVNLYEYKVSGNSTWTTEDEVWLAYDIYFDPLFDFASGFKMPGLRAKNLGSGILPNIGDYAYCLMMCHGQDKYPGIIPDGTGAIGLYYSPVTSRRRHLKAAVSDYSNTSGSIYVPPSGFYSITRGQWFRVKIHLTMNTATTNKLIPDAVLGVDYLKDGEAEIYIDGALRGHRYGMAWRTHQDLGFNEFAFEHFWGGGDSTWNNPREQGPFLKNIVVQTTDPDS